MLELIFSKKLKPSFLGKYSSKITGFHSATFVTKQILFEIVRW